MHVRPDVSARGMRPLGVVLIASAVLSLVLMGHHPVVRAHDDASLIQSIVDSAGWARGVHGGLIALLLAQAAALLEFTWRDSHWSSRTGMWFWAVGAMTMLGAALLSGFVGPAVAEHATRGDLGSAARAADLLMLAHAANQALAKCGVACWAAAIALWSWRLPMRAQRPRDAFVIAVAGVGALVAALALSALFVFGLRLDVHGMGAALLAIAIWVAALGALAAARRIG